jgi:hypothetical protein
MSSLFGEFASLSFNGSVVYDVLATGFTLSNFQSAMKTLIGCGASAPPSQRHERHPPPDYDSKKNERLQLMKQEAIELQRICQELGSRTRQEQQKRAKTMMLGNPLSVDQVAILDRQLSQTKKKYAMQRQ